MSREERGASAKDYATAPGFYAYNAAALEIALRAARSAEEVTWRPGSRSG